jgi:predicted peptidase
VNVQASGRFIELPPHVLSSSQGEKGMKLFHMVSRGYSFALIQFTILASLGINVQAAGDQPIERRGASRASVVTSARMPYLAITPANFRGQTRWPLIIFLHGSDQRGTDLNVLKLSGPVKYALNNPGFPFVVVAPQLAPGKIWNGELVARFANQLISRFRIDPARIYLTGVSTGGYGVWSAALQHPERWAAVVPVAGGGNTVIPKHAEGAQLSALQSLGVWAFHGGSDSIVDPSESQRMVSELQRIGAGDVRVTVFPGAPHDVWNQVFDDPSIYSWLLGHQR